MFAKRLLPASLAAAPRLGASSWLGLGGRSLCAGSVSRARVFCEMPPVSNRRERIQQHGLVGLTAAFVQQSSEKRKGETGADSFRVSSYTIPLNRPAEFALTQVYGFGRKRSKARRVLAAVS